MDWINDSLSWIVTHTDVKLAQHLIDYGADVNYNDYTPIKNALNYGNVEMIKLLLQNGAVIPDGVYIDCLYSGFLQKYHLFAELNELYKLDHQGIMSVIIKYEPNIYYDVFKELSEYVSDVLFYESIIKNESVKISFEYLHLFFFEGCCLES
jgi:ankyrin repeat protein